MVVASDEEIVWSVIRMCVVSVRMRRGIKVIVKEKRVGAIISSGYTKKKTLFRLFTLS